MKERGNKPYDLELMLRIHLIQNLYDLSDGGRGCMTLFTKNPLERLMMQRPYPGKEETPRTPAPEGHFCCGCSRYGTVCLRPCYRDTDLREKLRGKAPER